MHISSSYAKILGETNFPRSGSKAKDGEKREKKREERLNDGNNNGKATHGARMVHTSTHGARKPPRPIFIPIYVGLLFGYEYVNDYFKELCAPGI